MVEHPTRPPNLENLTRVDAFPYIVAAFLVLLAALAVAHALVMSVQRRARDLALLKALGFVGSQIRATVSSQASTLAVVGLAVGIPAGIVVGRLAWTFVAGNLGVDDRVPVPLVAVVATIPIALALANLIAVVPGRTAAQARIDVVLRRE